MATHQIPNGKVYKQLIDDQQALARCIESNKIFAKASSAKQANKDDGKVQEWLQAAPYEYRKQNPVLNKQLRTLENVTDTDQSGIAEAVNDVKNLPDVVVAAKLSSDIADRIARSRKERHFTEVENMHHELATIAKNCEDLLRTECAGIIEKLTSDNHAADSKLSAISADEALYSLEMNELTALWNDIHSHLGQHRIWIDDFWKSIQAIEDERLSSIRKIFVAYGETLKTIAHMLPYDLQNYLDNEAQTINKVILSNRRQYVELRARLNLTEIMLDRRRFLHYNRRIRHWREHRTEQYIEDFKTYISSPEIVHSQEVQSALAKIAEQQENKNAPRLGLLNEAIAVLSPPMPIQQPALKSAGTPVVVMQLQQQPMRPRIQSLCRELSELNGKVDTANQEASSILGSAHNIIIQRCFDHVQAISHRLMEEGAAGEIEAERICHSRLLPFIAELQRRLESDLTLFDRLMEQHNYEAEKETETLMRFLLGVATIWDDHELELSKRERNLDERLLAVRQNHDAQIQRNELRLDRTLDKLRQSGNTAALQQNLTAALKQLDLIKDGHELFFKDTTTHIKTFPDKVASTVKKYEKDLFRYLLIRRQPPTDSNAKATKTRKVPAANDNKAPSAAAAPPPRVKKSVSPTGDAPEGSQSQRSSNASPTNRSTKPKLLRDSTVASSVSGKLGEVPVEGKKEDDSSEDDNLQDQVDDNNEEESDVFTALANDANTGLSYRVVIEEVLRTKGGDMLYVLARSDDPDVAKIAVAEATDPSAPVEKPPIDTGDQFDQPVFITEDDLIGVDLSQPHLYTSAIPKGLFREVKKRIRGNFVNHLELWTIGMRTRAKQILQSKLEELQCEYDLRLQLHAPRADIIKKDVHDVRMSELRYHQQRVDAHCAGAVDRLDKIHSEFTALLAQHDRWLNDFETLVSKITAKVEEVTKSAKLATLQKQTQTEQERTMDLVRTSLRDMRRKLEDTSNALRIANSDLTKNFKLFSEGGNFSPEEIMEFREKLDQVGKRIDETEGNILGEMEGIEARRLKQCATVVATFEEQIKYPMQDLVFLEKVAQIFANTQCKVKAEASDSNSFSIQLRQMIEKLERRIDAVLKPNLEKEQIEAVTVNASLSELSEMCRQRAIYLDCLVAPSANAGAKQQTGAQGVATSMTGSVTGLEQGTQPQALPPPVSVVHTKKKGRGRPSLVPSSAINLPKPPPATPQPVAGVAATAPAAPTHATSRNVKEVESFATIRALLADEERKPLPPIGGVPASEQSDKKKSEQGSKKGDKGGEKQAAAQPAVPPTAGEESSDARRKSSAVGKQQAGRVGSIDTKKPRPPSAGLLGNTRQARIELEKLYRTFGETEDYPNEDFNLLGRSRIMIRAALEALLQAGEVFYRAKEEFRMIKQEIQRAAMNARHPPTQSEWAQLSNRLRRRPYSVKRLDAMYASNDNPNLSPNEADNKNNDTHTNNNQPINDNEHATPYQSPKCRSAVRISAKPAVLETFEEYSDMVVKRLTSYWDQTREYHSDCVQEFRHQLVQIEELAQGLPEVVIAERYLQRLENVNSLNEGFVKDAMALADDNGRKKAENENQLRPGLGHPQQEPLLTALCAVEEQRHKDFVKRLEQLHSTVMDAQLKESAQFYADLQRDAHDLLMFYDSIMTAADIVRGEIVQRKLPTIALIHRAQQVLVSDLSGASQAKVSLESIINQKPEIPPETLEQSGPRNWPALTSNPDLLPAFLMANSRSLKNLLSPLLAKTDHATLPQHSVIRARDTIAQKYKAGVEKVVNELETLYAYLQETESKWYEKWVRSVDGVRRLYTANAVRAPVTK